MDIDPYTPPRAESEGAIRDHASRKWRVEAGALWVQDGAELPPVCLFGSSGTDHIVRAWITLVWMSPLLQRIGIACEVLALGVLFTIAMRGIYGALSFAGIVIVVSLLLGGISLLFMRWKKHRRRVKIFRVLGRRRFLRTWVFSLAVFGAYFMALSMMAHFEKVLKLGQLQQIGLSNTLMLAAIMVQVSGRMLLMPHVAEIEGEWFRLASIHPRAIDEFARIQEEALPTRP